MRASFFMPTGTNVGATPAVSITPVQVFCDDVTSLFISGTVTVNIGGAAPVTYDAADFGSAQRIIQQINNVMQTNNPTPVLITDTASAVVWGGISSNPTPVLNNNPTNYIVSITGTGFSGSGINQLKLDDGAGDVVIVDPPNIVSDVSIIFGTVDNEPAQFPAAGNYAISSSADGGMTWAATGLTLVVN